MVFQHFNRTNFSLLKSENFSKDYCLSIFEPMYFLRRKFGLLDILYRHRIDSEDLNVTIFSNISLKFTINFI